MKAKISEIFRSIQGEGKYIGVDQVFVRFYECNLNCAWCDTPTSQNSQKIQLREMSVQEVVDAIEGMGGQCHSISLTGGEPLLQKDFLKELLPQLKKKEQMVYLETNGILHEYLDEIIEYVDIVSMDIKLPSATGAGDFWQDHEIFLTKCLAKDIFVKAVVTKDTAEVDMQKTIEMITGIDPCTMLVLQPETSQLRKGALEQCRKFQSLCMQTLNDVRIIPQVQKYMEVQ